jgi:predicted SprT family Zn-dependent metalloprotease
MNQNNYKKILLIITIIGVIVLLISLFDIVFNFSLMLTLIILYMILLILSFTLIIIYKYSNVKGLNNIKQFEKTLKGGLYHFKCQTCNGIFAIKRSKSNNNKPIKMSCPDCGEIGFIPPYPVSIEEEIPEKKSINFNFKCNNCGEGLTIWAEGTDIYQNMKVFSCPFCGTKKPLIRF